MKEITAVRGDVILVDDEDYEHLSQFAWRVCRGYAFRNNKGRGLLMHREVMGAKRGQLVDHANLNGLDNRRENLRFCNRSQNAANGRIRKTNKSGFKGAWFDRTLGRWRASITLNWKTSYLGCFDTPEEAACAYQNAAVKLFKEFARPNG